MDDTYVSRFQEFCHPASGRPAITSCAGMSVVGLKITGFVLVCLLCLGLGSQMIRADMASRSNPSVNVGPSESWRVAGATAGTDNPQPSVSSLMRRSGLSYLERPRRRSTFGQVPYGGPSIGPDTVVVGDTNMHDQRAGGAVSIPGPTRRSGSSPSQVGEELSEPRPPLVTTPEVAANRETDRDDRRGRDDVQRVGNRPSPALAFVPEPIQASSSPLERSESGFGKIDSLDKASAFLLASRTGSLGWQARQEPSGPSRGPVAGHGTTPSEDTRVHRETVQEDLQGIRNRPSSTLAYVPEPIQASSSPVEPRGTGFGEIDSLDKASASLLAGRSGALASHAGQEPSGPSRGPIAGYGTAPSEEFGGYRETPHDDGQEIRNRPASALACLPASNQPSRAGESLLETPDIVFGKTAVPDKAAEQVVEPIRTHLVSNAARLVESPEERNLRSHDPIGVNNPFVEESRLSSQEKASADPECPEMDFSSISSVTADIRLEEQRPRDCAKEKFLPWGETPDGAMPGREWTQVVYQYEASSLCHRPLYFEEVNLERHGYMWRDHHLKGVPAAIVQPVLSGARFFATIPALPYLVVAEPPGEGIYALGHYRPGSPAPYQIHRPPVKPLAGTVEACAVTGRIFAIP